MARKSKKDKLKVADTTYNILTIFSYTFIGKMALYIILALLIALFTGIIVGDDYNKFFRALGVEVLIATFAGWIMFLAVKK